jgi:hypothetical protein
LKDNIPKVKKLKINKKFIPCQVDNDDELFPNGIFEFNISKILEFIKANPDRVKLLDIKVADLYAHSSINESHIDSVDITIPVILAEISPDNYNLIDGHHRVEKARRLNIQALKAYRLNVNQHINFLTSLKAYLSYVEYWNSKIGRY